MQEEGDIDEEGLWGTTVGNFVWWEEVKWKEPVCRDADGKVETQVQSE